MRFLTKTLLCVLVVFAVSACTTPTDDEPAGDTQGSTPDTPDESGSDGGGVVTKTASLALSQLGALRGGRGVYAPAGLLAILQGGMESAMFTSEESTDGDGNRVVTTDYAGSSLLDIDGTLPTGTRTETYDPDGRFLSWKWDDGGQYNCNYGENVTCILTSKEGEMCTDTFDYEGAYVKTTCADDPPVVFSCSETDEGEVLCDSEIESFTCYDRFSGDLKLEEAGCGGFFNASSLCAAVDDLVRCEISWLGADCTLELDWLFNLKNRTCTSQPTNCSWGGSDCPLEDLCTCAWRASALAALCDDEVMDNVKVDEPDATNLLQILLGDGRPVDGSLYELFVDTAKAEFYLRVTNSGFGGPDTVGPYWYGPFKLEDPGCS